MADFGVQLWTGDLASYFDYCRRQNEADQARWRIQQDAAPACEHGVLPYVDGVFVPCMPCYTGESA